MEGEKHTPPRIVVLDKAEVDRLVAATLLQKSLQSEGAVKRSRLGNVVRDVAGRLDRAITLGVASAYPIVINMPTPDPVPDWKHVVKVGWKIVKTTMVETIRILTDGEQKP